jgi:superfamily II DNA helicase RecQ
MRPPHRKDCEGLARELQAAGLTAAHYHADMEPAEREAAHSAWSSGAVQVVVATIAFGMGINKPDVRFVLHHSLSKRCLALASPELARPGPPWPALAGPGPTWPALA